MNTNQILSSSLLDILFQNRNKSYGAYELRKTYPQRIGRALLITFLITGSGIAALAISTSLKPKEKPKMETTIVELTALEEEEPEVIPPPEKLPQPEPEQIRTEQLSTIDIVDDKDVQEPPPSQDDLKDAKIDLFKQDGVADIGLASPKDLGDDKGILEIKKDPAPDGGIFTAVEIEAEFDGNWIRFLERTLNPNVPVDNNAPAGTYRVLVQFVVDVDGSVSDIKPLSSAGYGMEQEALRVLKKAKKWKPAFQNGTHVKAYRKQLITFIVNQE